jgi:hypothetical protein
MDRLETMMRLFCALLLLVGVSAAAADIRIDESSYANGERLNALTAQADKKLLAIVRPSDRHVRAAIAKSLPRRRPPMTI